MSQISLAKFGSGTFKFSTGIGEAFRMWGEIRFGLDAVAGFHPVPLTQATGSKTVAEVDCQERGPSQSR
jgi:hypothetical protein